MLTPNILLQNRYQVLRPIGRGGMGTVYEATDTRLHSTVALKQTLLTDNASRRAFEREAQLLARLRHPALPKVIDHFSEDSGQFLVMEFIAGDDLSALMDKQPQGRFPMSAVLPWVLRWGDQLLDALDYLHRQSPSIYHRDIKPQNLKLTARGDIILLDFGLAKGGMTEASTLTARDEKLMGFTPNYAPLEQIRGSEPDARSDLYSLAATLYHLLIGEKPPDALSRVAALLNEQPDPLRPASDLNPHVTPTVAVVIQKAMASNVEERFESAAAMRKALYEARHTRQAEPAPVTVHRPSTEVGLVSPPASSTISPQFSLQQQTLLTKSGSGDTTTRPLHPSEVPDISGAELGTPLDTFQIGSPVGCIALSPDGRVLAVGCDDSSISLWDMHERELITILEGHKRSVSSLTFSPDGQILASGSEDTTICLWSPQDGSLMHRKELSGPIESVAFSPDGHMLTFGGWCDSVFLCRIDDYALHDMIEIVSGFVNSLAFSQDGQLLTAGCYDSTVRVWRMKDRHPLHTLSGHTNFVLTTAFSPNARTLASGGGETNIHLWRVRDGRMLDTLKGHTNFVRSVAYSPNGKMLASASEDKTVRLWHVSDGSPIKTLEAHTEGVTSVLFTGDGNLLLSGSRDAKVRLWQGV